VPAWAEFLVLIACLVGVAGTVLPVLPGHLLIGSAIVIWGLIEHSWISLAVTVAAIGALILGSVLTYLIPGKQMSAAGVPASTLLIGSAAGLVGLFVVPFVGLPLFFIGAVYLTEFIRLRSHREATPATLEAMKAAVVSTLIGMTAGVVATSVWAIAAMTT
jgi:uncharacterized protein YqgC (DUF456 family)